MKSWPQSTQYTLSEYIHSCSSRTDLVSLILTAPRAHIRGKYRCHRESKGEDRPASQPSDVFSCVDPFYKADTILTWDKPQRLSFPRHYNFIAPLTHKVFNTWFGIIKEALILTSILPQFSDRQTQRTEKLNILFQIYRPHQADTASLQAPPTPISLVGWKEAGSTSAIHFLSEKLPNYRRMVTFYQNPSLQNDKIITRLKNKNKTQASELKAQAHYQIFLRQKE